MKRILPPLLLLCLSVRAQIPLLINEVDQSVFYPTGAIGGTLTASNVAVVSALTIGGQTFTNLAGSGLTNNAGTLQATGGGGGGSGSVTSVGATSSVAGLSFSGSPITVAGTLGLTGIVGAASIDASIARLTDITNAQAALVASNLWQRTNVNLTTVANLTGGTSSNFFSGDGTFKQVTTNMVPGLVEQLAAVRTNLLNVLPSVPSGANHVLDFAYSAMTYAVSGGNVNLLQSTNRPASATNVAYTVMRLAGDTVDRTLSWHASWKRLGTNITVIPSNKVVLVSAMVIGTAESGVTFGVAKEE
jgi:hypothetical protein